MTTNFSLKATLLTIATSMLLLFFSATPASAQTEFLSPSGIQFAFVVAGTGFVAGYAVAPHLVQAWVNRKSKAPR